MILAGTGHRPKYLGLDYSETSNNLLTKFIAEIINTLTVTRIISGGATGFDQALAETSISLNIPLTVAVPFPSFHSKWPPSGIKRFNNILQKADVVHTVSPDPYNNSKFILRDKWMVDNCDMVIALYDIKNTSSGTGATVRYAEKLKKEVYNIWTLWEKFKRENI